jgi:hypothetical protein
LDSNGHCKACEAGRPGPCRRMGVGWEGVSNAEGAGGRPPGRQIILNPSFDAKQTWHWVLGTTEVTGSRGPVPGPVPLGSGQGLGLTRRQAAQPPASRWAGWEGGARRLRRQGRATRLPPPRSPTGPFPTRSRGPGPLSESSHRALPAPPLTYFAPPRPLSLCAGPAGRAPPRATDPAGLLVKFDHFCPLFDLLTTV